MRTHRNVALMSAVLLFTAACGGTDTAADAASNAGTSRKIELAPAKQAPPALNDVPLPAPAPAKPPVKVAAKAPVKPDAAPTVVPVPAPAPKAEPQPVVAPPTPLPPPPPATGSVAAGAALTLKPSSRICTNTHRAGDRFTATVASTVQGTNGVEIPAGSVAVFRIVDASKGAGGRDTMQLAYEIVSVKVGDETYEVVAHVAQSTPLERVNTQSNTDKATKVGAGALIGAIAGRVLGGNTKGAVIGGVVGGAAGAAVAAKANDYNGCLTEAGTVTLALDRALTLKIAPKP